MSLEIIIAEVLIALVLSGLIFNLAYAELTEKEKVAKRQAFYDSHPDIPRPDDLTTEGLKNR